MLICFTLLLLDSHRASHQGYHFEKAIFKCETFDTLDWFSDSKLNFEAILPRCSETCVCKGYFTVCSMRKGTKVRALNKGFCIEYYLYQTLTQNFITYGLYFL